jgi:hypothetical protein
MITLKIEHGEQKDEFMSWLAWAVDECCRNGAPATNWHRYNGAQADYWELWGNEGIQTYAKLKWG